jgi:acetylornithine/succinyldiaminopimelate/putrescine aminotransferase/predicted amino acid dehydrogenase
MHIETVGSSDLVPAQTALNPQRSFLLEHIGFDKTIVRAEGHHLIDQQGNRYLDALAQYGAVPFGHNPSYIWDALLQVRATAQPGFVQPLLNTGAETLARKLVSLLPGMARVCFVSTGAEATEVAIKLARARTERRRILTVERGFHGKTNAALCATANPKYRAPFLVDAEQFTTLPFGDLTALEQALQTREVAAFIVEPVQGEGGMRVQPTGYLLAAQALCKRHGTLLVMDEVQCGLGRTGTLFGHQQHGELRPDVVLLAKALGGGLMPLGAVVCTEDAWTEAFGMLHSSTFANSHLTTTVGLAALQVLEADEGALLRQIQQRGAMLRAGLEQLAQRYPTAIVAIHGQGLMQGIELRPWPGASSYFNAHASGAGYAVAIVAGYLLNQQRILTAPTFNTSHVLRVQPSLTISEAEIAMILRGLEAAMALIANEDFAELFSCMVPTTGRAEGSTAPRRAKPRPPVLKPAARPASRPSGPDAAKPRRFAFLMHPTDDDALFNILPESVRQQGAAVREPWLRWMNSWTSRMPEPAPVFHVENFQSRTGVVAEGWLIATPLTPTQMIKMGSAAREQLMQSYLAEARKVGADIVGLGAFTSVISQGGLSVADCGLNLTTGNSLTAVASAESLLHHANRQRGLQSTFAVIGAAGSVGRVAAFHLAHRGAARLNLVGNATNQRANLAMRAVGGEILLHVLQHGSVNCVMAETLRRAGVAHHTRWLARAPSSEADFAHAYEELALLCVQHGVECPITVTTDLTSGLRNARYVLTATSAGRSFITPDTFMHGAVVCDVARPLDVAKRVADARSDLTIYEGGLMCLPNNMRFGSLNVLGYPDGINLACLSESMVLALEGVSGHHSLGNRIDYAQALRILQLAHKHGFDPLLDPLPTDTDVPAALPRLAAVP